MPESPILSALMDVIAERKARPPAERSYVVSLLRGGVATIGGKIVEEAADLVFHTLVLLGYRDIAWSEVEDELSRRFGISGIVEKESRGPSS